MDRIEAENVLTGLAGLFAGSAAPTDLAAVFLGAAEPRRSGELPNVEARYRALVEQIPAVIFMAFLDRGISEAYVSPYIEDVLGFSQREWLDDPVRWYRQIHPDDKERWSCEAAQLLISGEPLRSTYRVLACDGHVVWFQCEAKLVRNESGHPWFIHGLAVDITELRESQLRLQEAHQEAELRARQLEIANLKLRAEIAEREAAEKSLRASEEKFRLLVEGAKDYAIFMLDCQGRVVSWNEGARRLKGYTTEEILGVHFGRFYLPEDVARGEPQIVLSKAEAQGRYEMEGWRRRKDGSKFWASVVITALRDEQGRLYGFSKLTRDTSEWKALHDKLQESERLAAMGTTAAVFAHEIGNPLNGISSTLQLLQMQSANGPANAVLNETLNDVLKEVYRLGDLLNDFRSLARPRQLEFAPTSLTQVVSEVMALQAASCAEHGVITNVDVAPDLPPIMADSRRLKQAIINLCKNAIEAMPSGGQLGIRITASDRVIETEISETGV